ncbi:hypothetical protein QYF36_008567 [Acer negundo]|nr:hypothetical protein QYF36_008567 [Acer negundo]
MAYTFNQKRVPEFFIVYLPEHSSESLFIPDAFVTLWNRLILLLEHRRSISLFHKFELNSADMPNSSSSFADVVCHAIYYPLPCYDTSAKYADMADIMNTKRAQ